jgi:hypothetical protein
MAMVTPFRRPTRRSLIVLFLASVLGTPAQAQSGREVRYDQSALPSDWRRAQEDRANALANYLGQKPIAYRWFTDFPFGLTSGEPYIVLKLLPRLAPEQWGSKDNFLDVVGLIQ